MFETPRHKLVLADNDHHLKFFTSEPQQPDSTKIQPDMLEYSSPVSVTKKFVSLQQINVTGNHENKSSHLSKSNNLSLPENMHFKKNSMKYETAKPRMSSSLVSLPSSNTKPLLEAKSCHEPLSK